MRHSNKERDNVAESRPGSNTASATIIPPYVLSHVKTNNKSPTKYFELDSASCRAAKELSLDTNRASLRQLLAAQ